MEPRGKHPLVPAGAQAPEELLGEVGQLVADDYGEHAAEGHDEGLFPAEPDYQENQHQQIERIPYLLVGEDRPYGVGCRAVEGVYRERRIHVGLLESPPYSYC